MERIVAFVLLIILSPILYIFYLAVKLTSRGPFIFKQKRVGKDKKIFTLYKIRTMVDKAEIMKKDLLKFNETGGPVFKIKHDPRYTMIGKWLSHLGLDEGLQLINIIQGDMSFVGPRPLPVEEAEKIPRQYQLRFSVKPGITSLWVIRGAHSLSFDEWMKSDIEYVKNKSKLLDLIIFFNTLKLISKWLFKLF